MKLATSLDAAGDFVTSCSGLDLGCLSVAEKDVQVIVEAQQFTHDQGRPTRQSDRT